MLLIVCCNHSFSLNSENAHAKICDELALLQESRNRTITDYLHLTAGDMLLEPGMVRGCVYMCFTHHLHLHHLHCLTLYFTTRLLDSIFLN